jgi:hypothetical protein
MLLGVMYVTNIVARQVHKRANLTILQVTRSAHQGGRYRALHSNHRRKVFLGAHTR